MLNANGAKVTLKNGNIQTAARLGNAVNGGEIIIESGNYNSTREVAFSATGEGSKVVLNGGKITAQEGGIGAFRKGEIEINGGEIEVRDNFALFTNGNNGQGGNKITINGGKLIGNITSSGYEAIALYAANNDEWIINDGEIVAYGGTAICQRGGQITINGGTITATNTNKVGQAVADGKIGDGSTVLTGCSAIVMEKNASYQNSGMNLTVKGGTITGVDKSIDAIGFGASETPNITVSGGTLTPAYPAA